jgi:Cupin-like domain
MAARMNPVPTAAVAERAVVDARTFSEDILASHRPVVLRGQVARWASVAAGAGGDRALAEYLARFGGGQPLDVMIGPPAIKGRFFYADESLDSFNFQRQQVPLGQLVGELLRFSEQGIEAPHALYANSATAPEHLPGWETENCLNLPVDDTPARLWIGNETVVATHYDTSFNIACVVAGRRRFTLFPPEQLANLYVGPLDRTFAGPPTSMVDPEAPDLARYPRFAEAQKAMTVADLDPGDAIVIPPLWWHHVRAFDRLNVLVNYWWDHRSGAAFLALIHAVMSVRDLPPNEKAAFKSWFDHLVFADDAANAADHLPENARTVLGPYSAARSERLRAFLIGMLSR